MSDKRGEMLSPPRYGKTAVHVGIVGTEVSLCDRPTIHWSILQPSPTAERGVDLPRVSCRICAKRWPMVG